MVKVSFKNEKAKRLDLQKLQLHFKSYLIESIGNTSTFTI